MNNNRMGNERNSTDLHQQFASMNIATPVGNLVGDNNQQKTKFFNKSKYNKSLIINILEIFIHSFRKRETKKPSRSKKRVNLSSK